MVLLIFNSLDLIIVFICDGFFFFVFSNFDNGWFFYVRCVRYFEVTRLKRFIYVNY